MKKLFQKEWIKNKYAFGGVAAAVLVGVFFVGEVFFNFSPSAAKVLDARVTFKFTTYQDRDQYFISYSLENKKKVKIKTVTRVQLGEPGLGGAVFHTVKAQNDTAVLEPLETKSFVVEMDIPKSNKKAKEREFGVRAKVKRVSRG